MADVQMFYIEDDIKKIQTKTNLYLQQYGPEGAFHLAREIIQNSIDELIDKDSSGKKISIEYDKLTDTLTVEDDGRGFPEYDYPLDVFFTKIQSGSKFFRSQSGETSGEYGLGLTAVCALSDVCEVTNYRDIDGYSHRIRFEEGKKVKDTRTKQTKKHGCRISFKPSKKYLGANTELPFDDLVKWIDKMCYLIRGEKFKFTVDLYEGLTLKESKTFKKKNFNELLDLIAPNKSYSGVCQFSGTRYTTEKVRVLNTIDSDVVEEEEIKREIHLQVALRYVPEQITYYDSYCNYTNTTEGGVHQNTVDACFCRYMQLKTNASLSDAQKEKLGILWDDVRSGLCCVINLATNAQVGFVGNAKQKIGNEELIPFIKDIVNKELDKFFEKNPAVLNDFIKIIKINAKARIEMLKVKNATQKERMTSFRELTMDNYIPCNNRGKQWKEIFLTEGKSAAGSGRNGCDPDTQAFFIFRGVTANALKRNLAEIMNNREWRDFVSVLRCGIGPTFDISKLYFNRINILTDEDIDGFGISSGMLAFIYMYLRPLVEQGYVYKVHSPLYKLDDKKHKFVRNKSEIIDIYHSTIAKNCKVDFIDVPDEKYDLREFLDDSYDYSADLQNIADSIGRVDKFFIERIYAALVLSGHLRFNQSASGSVEYDDMDKLFANQKFITEFMAFIQAEYPETACKKKTISGHINGKYYSIKITDRFLRMAAGVIRILVKYGYRCKIQDKKDAPMVKSIGGLLDYVTKYTAKILARYKGLGEVNSDELFDTTLDINNRISVRYTVEDAARETAIFRKLHGSSKKDMAARKEMMHNFKISRHDIDN